MPAQSSTRLRWLTKPELKRMTARVRHIEDAGLAPEAGEVGPPEERLVRLRVALETEGVSVETAQRALLLSLGLEFCDADGKHVRVR